MATSILGRKKGELIVSSSKVTMVCGSAALCLGDVYMESLGEDDDAFDLDCCIGL